MVARQPFVHTDAAMSWTKKGAKCIRSTFGNIYFVCRPTASLQSPQSCGFPQCKPNLPDEAGKIFPKVERAGTAATRRCMQDGPRFVGIVSWISALIVFCADATVSSGTGVTLQNDALYSIYSTQIMGRKYGTLHSTFPRYIVRCPETGSRAPNMGRSFLSPLSF